MVSRIILFFRTRNEKQVLLLLLGMTFGLRLYAVLMAKGIAVDSCTYGFIARDFLKGDFIKGLSLSAAPPLYPFLIFLFSIDPAHVEIAGRLLSLFFGTFAIIPLFYLVKEAIGQREAVLSALFYSFHPYLVTYSGMLLTEATYWGLLTLSVYLFWTGLKKERAWRTTLSGFFLGLAYLTRPEGIGYVLVFVIWIVVDGGFDRKWFRKVLHLGGLILAFSICFIPYIVYLHQETGQWLMSKKAVEAQSPFLGMDDEEADPSEADPSRGVEQNKPGKQNFKIPGVIQNVVQYLPFVSYHYLRAYHFSLWIFLLFGLIRTRKREMEGELFLASLVFFHLISLSTFTPSTIRFSVPLIPISLFWAGSGVSEIQKWFERRNISKPENWVVAVMILFILIQLPQSLKPERRHRADQKNVGLWLKENIPKNAVIMSSGPIEAFYAEREFVFLPRQVPRGGIPGQSYQEIVRFAKESGIHYILVNKHTREMNPDFERSIRPTDLREFYRYRGKGGNMIIVYEVMD